MMNELPEEVRTLASVFRDERDREFGTTSPGLTLGDVLRAIEALTGTPDPFLHRDQDEMLADFGRVLARAESGPMTTDTEK